MLFAPDGALDGTAHGVDTVFADAQGDHRTKDESERCAQRDPDDKELLTVRLHAVPQSARAYWTRTTAGASAQRSSS